MILFTNFTFTSCQEKGTIPSIKLIEALVLYTGEPEVDGCGYMLKIGDEQYKPLNLSPQHQTDSLELLIEYEVDPTGFHCGDLPHPKTTVRLIEAYKK